MYVYVSFFSKLICHAKKLTHTVMMDKTISERSCHIFYDLEISLAGGKGVEKRRHHIEYIIAII